MHLTRPKSSKGRSRPTVNHTLYGDDTASIQNPPVTPKSPVHSRSHSYLCSQSQSRSHTMMRQTSQLTQDEVVHMLQFVPAVPALSLNKYKVLPSIEKRQSEVNPGSGVEKKMSKLNLSDNVILQQGQGEPSLSGAMTPAVTRPDPSDPGPTLTRETTEGSSSAGAAGSLLLAIRAPCGRRFQQHFRPTDTLLTVRASAEARYGARYGEAFIETMDVPRRTFTDMDMTLAQCGILNRSVLCISQEDSL
ncbi:UBX domain-containing protein 10 [Centroberyx affinis]|uniref:UBX domain-containing protein 10 n=1 Tax=Centroberyx affinis TaxID=166261 RepID=UPI003A5B9DE0